MLEKLFQDLEDIYPELVGIRRDLHMYPELSNLEERTPEIIAKYLKKLGLEVKTNVGGNGVVGYLRGSHPGETIALRADFDALPIQDQKEISYKSKVNKTLGSDPHRVKALK